MIGQRVTILDDEYFLGCTGIVTEAFPSEESGDPRYGGIDYDWIVKLDVPSHGLSTVAVFAKQVEII